MVNESSFESIAKRQYELGVEINQINENCRKAPKDRRTSQFYATKIQKLQQIGEEFFKNNALLLALKEQNKDNDYFTNDYFNTTNGLLIEITKKLERQAMDLVDQEGGAAKPKDDNAEFIKRKLVRNIKALLEVLNRTIDDIANEQQQEHPQVYYSIKAAVLERHMVDLTQNNAALWEITDETQVEGYTLQTYYEVESKVEAALINLQQNISTDPVNTTLNRSNEQQPTSVKLPRISLPTFNGEYLQWASFKDLFVEVVHNANISDAQRMQYLTQSLKDEPKNLIKHLPSTGNNYAAAWSILTSRYDNKRLIVSTLLNKLMSQPAVKSDSPATMKSLHDITKECLHGLKTQGLPIQHWDSFIAHIVLRKMDNVTQTAFEQNLDDCRRLVTQDEVLKFLEKRFQALEVRSSAEKSSKRTCGSVVNADGKCIICKKNIHGVAECSTFKNAAIKQKWHNVKIHRLCANCLKPGHQASQCKSAHCTKCTRRHNTLLHPEENKPKNSNANSTSLAATTSSEEHREPNTASNSNAISLLANQSDQNDNYVLLGTARIILVGKNGCEIECRAVLDSGSQVNLVTERIFKRLGLSTMASKLQLEGVGLKETTIRHRTSITVKSRTSEFMTNLNAHVISEIVSDQPSCRIRTENWKIPKSIILADPKYNIPGRVDCVLGAEICLDLLTNEKIKLGNDLPTLYNSVLGWVVTGSVGASNMPSAVCGICTTTELENKIAKFWKLEEIPDNASTMSTDDIQCEQQFMQNTTRGPDGRFIVRLPLKEHRSRVADTRELAYFRLKSIEKRLSENETLRAQYVAFMKEYESLGHMTEVKLSQIGKPHYFIPHHCVLRPESTSTKLRVVFDASAHRSSGLSLNDIMHTGPTVQSELFSILLRFRTYRYVLKMDVEKMYRQMWVHPTDRNLQLIMWRDKPSDKVKIFQLNTITYGTRAAPYLATRCLNQLADENMNTFPNGAAAIKLNFYVDDGLVGANSLREADEIRQQLIIIFESAGMKLKKWCSNTPKLLQGITSNDQEVPLNFDSDDIQSTKTLGLTWLPKSDMLGVKANVKRNMSTTKRSITSDLAHIYDPLGLVGPVIVTAKIFIQQLWQQKFDWDTNLPNHLQQTWCKFRDDLPAIETTQIPRYIFEGQEQGMVQLHAFADASERAYGAAIYARIVQKDHSIRVNLLCSKSRVAPLKLQTIPKLELCAAQIAAELMARVKSDLGYQNKRAYFWSDSQIVLSWINHHPGTLLPFVAHRVMKIREHTVPDQWHYVASKHNPADILSRGLKPRELSSNNMWFYGPMFLYQEERSWPMPYREFNDSPVVALTTPKSTEANSTCWIYSVPTKNSFWYVQRVVGYVLRFIRNTKRPEQSRPISKQLSPMELDAALKVIIRQIQLSDFADVIKTLKRDKFVPNSHHLSSLTPFLDEEGTIRVGGRLNAATQGFDANHQMILPGNDPLVRLLVEKIHREHYHCGPQALLAQLRQRFWPLKGKSLARSVVQRCIKCTRAKPIFYEQIMGNLPLPRVEAVRPFLNSGVDYCGPFWVHYKVRGKRPQKAYLAVFCCFASKAVHLELVTDLTTDAFIGALKRFIARRGHCKALYSDNATNFVGAKNKLEELNDIIYSENAKNSIIRACSKKGIEFHFIPPRSPHFGGLWEAAVKSAKHLLLKNVSTASLTYEELETVIIEIEAILNSRPITPNPADPNDLNAITPGHLLIGDELTSSVDVNVKVSNHNLTQRWQQVSELKRQFWKRWSAEYLNQLQQRYKWKGHITDIPENTMVIVKEDDTPVLQWPLGRIMKTYKGDDGCVRVCDVKMKNGIYKRAVRNLAPLFPDDATIEAPSMNTELEPNQASESQPGQPEPSLRVSIPLSRLRKAEHTEEMPARKTSRLQANLLVTLMALLLLPVALCSPIKVTQFNTIPGIYFEQIGTVRLSTTNWNIVAYYDLEPYHTELEFLHNGTQGLKELCEQTSNCTHCHSLVKFFEETCENLETKFKLFTVKRTKRGAVDIVGNIANTLFGVLDSNYETKMSATIKELKDNGHHLERLLKNQTSVIDSTINVMKQAQINTKAKFDELDKRINELLIGHAIDSPLHQLHLETAISTLTIQMFMVVSTLQRAQASIMEVLIDSHHGKINPLLLTPRQLSDEIVKIKSHLTQQLQLPIDSTNLLQIYKLLSVDGVVAENHIIFTIQLPISDMREFQLFHLEPIIVASNKSLVAVKTTINLLAISLHRDDFFSLTDAQLDACLQLTTNSYLCHNIQASYHKPIHTGSCEMDLFTNETEPRCELRTLQESTVWYQLRHPNQWVFATTNTIKLNAVCEEDTFQLTLNTSGIVQIQPNCVIKNELITIQGHKEMQTNLHTSYIGAHLPIISQFSPPHLNSNFGKTEVHPFKPTTRELEAIQEKLKAIKNSTLPYEGLSYHHHGLIIGYILLALLIWLLVRFIISKRRQRKVKFSEAQQQSPTAAPRHHSINTDC